MNPEQRELLWVRVARLKWRFDAATAQPCTQWFPPSLHKPFFGA